MEQQKVVKSGDYYEVHPVQEQSQLITDAKQEDSSSKNNSKLEQEKKIQKDNQEKLYQINGNYVMHVNKPADQGVTEHPIHKLNRLKSEVTQFKQEMEFINQKQKSINYINKENNLTILDELKSLEKQVGMVTESYQEALNSKAKDNFSIDPNKALLQNDLQNNINNNLIAQLKKIKQQEMENTLKPTEKPLQLELFLKNDSDKLQLSTNKYLEFDQRLSRIENILGTNYLSEELFLGNNNLLKRVETLEAKLTKLNQQTIEEAKTKIQTIALDTEKVQDLNIYQKLSLEEIKKIDTLYDQIQYLSGISEDLPLLINKLEAIRILHEESGGLMKNIQLLTQIHNEILQNLNTNEQSLQQIQESFLQNYEQIQQNVITLEQKISTLQQQPAVQTQ